MGHPFFESNLFSDVANYGHHAPAAWTELPLGETLRRFRYRAGLRQGQLAKMAGIPQAHLSRLEKGRIEGRIETWRRLFGALDCRLLILPAPTRPLDRDNEIRAREFTAHLKELIHGHRRL